MASRGKIKDLTGFTMGQLTVAHLTAERYRNQVVWHCVCSCGNTKDVPSSSLVGGGTQSCGCRGGGRPAEDLTGQVFGSLTVLRRDKQPGDKYAFWQVRCSCGVEKRVSGVNLRSGGTVSCGAWMHRKERLTNERETVQHRW